MKSGLKAARSNTPAKKKTTLKKVCRKVVKQEGVKADGPLKKGYRYKKGGGVVKAKAATTSPKKKKTVTKKKKTAK